MRYDRQLQYYRRTFKRRLKENVPHDIVEYLHPYLGTSILDVGSGPISIIGQRAGVTVTACDICAYEYDSMWGDEVPIIPVEYQDMEHLTYPDNSFDIVHCVNAVDHTKDARAVISELQRVARNVVYMRHFPNQRSQLGGHHSWDIAEQDGKTLFKKGGDSFVVDWPTHIEDEQIVTIWTSQS